MSNNKFKGLIIEDDFSIRGVLETILETSGYKAFSAKTCSMGEMMLQSYVPDFVILDLGLPDKDGLDFISYARTFTSVPIIVISARVQEDDKVKALDRGANDYITKPFGTAELLARIRAVLRTSSGTYNNSAVESTVTVSDMVISYENRQVTVGGVDVKLTQTEYNIVAMLSRHLGKVLTYNRIITEIWGCPDIGSTKKLQVNMANIRRKLGTKPGDNRYIINEIGVGYRMRDDSEK